MAHVVRVLRSIPLYFSPPPFLWTMTNLKVIGFSNEITVKKHIQLDRDKMPSIEFEETLFEDSDSFCKRICVNLHSKYFQKVAGNFGLKQPLIIEKNEPTKMAKTFKFLKRLYMPEEAFQWLRVRIMYFLYSPPALYQFTRSDHSTFSLANQCPGMSTTRSFSRDQIDANGSWRMKISLLCSSDTLGVEIVFECLIFAQERVRDQDLMYSRRITVRVSQVNNDCDDFMRALQSVFIPCHFSGTFLEWTLPQHVDERKSERTLMVLGKCGCGRDTVLWMRKQFDVFLDAPSFGPQK
eukprot:4286888-Pleurochrysis_carterae.AAC.1